MRTKLIEVLILLFIGGLITYFVTRKEDDGSLKKLQTQVDSLINQNDSIHKLQAVLAGRDTMATRVHAQDSIAVVIAREESNQWRIKYGKVNHAPVTRYTVPQLDSAVNALIASRQH
jgi:hypothetical protein